MSSKASPDQKSSQKENVPRSVLKNTCLAFFALFVAGGVYFIMPATMEEGARRMATIFALAVVLWITEAIPLFATSLGVIALRQPLDHRGLAAIPPPLP